MVRAGYENLEHFLTGEIDMSYEIELPFPPSLNTYYRAMYNIKTKVAYITRSARGKAYRINVGRMIRGYPTLDGDLHVSVIMFPPDKRRRDLDNFDGKALWDALTKAGVWKDDSQVKSRYSEWGEVVKGGKVFVKISNKRK